MIDQLLVQLLDTELTLIQQKIVEDYLFDVIVGERVEIQKEYIEGEVSNEVGSLSFQQIIEMLKDKLG